MNAPDPVYQRLKQESEERGITMGAVIEGWMRKADTLDKLHAHPGTNLEAPTDPTTCNE